MQQAPASLAGVCFAQSYTFERNTNNILALKKRGIGISLCGTVLLLVLVGCSVTDEPDTALDCGRQFIIATYNGNFKRAGQLVIPDEKNRTLLNSRFEKPFRAKDGFGKQELSETPLIVKTIRSLDEENTTIIFENALNKKTDSIRVIFQGEVWRVKLAQE